ncbi:hypothetical protein OAU50_06840 [Planctomycetota bacterium]|nr:hypothetical protein [Planctomycetota bacterium]
MNQPLYFNNALLWLNHRIDDDRQFLKLSAIGLVVIALVITGILFEFIGIGGLIVCLVAGTILQFFFGGIRAEEPVISAETNRPRLLGVPRTTIGSMNYRHDYPEHIQKYIAVVLALVTAPVALSVLAWKMKKKRDRLAEMDTDGVASILALIAERDAAYLMDELTEELGSESATLALGDLVDLDSAVWLHEPDRVTLTQPAIDKIRE